MEVRTCSYAEKDRALRRIYDNPLSGPLYLIREDGKERLEKNLRTLISKLRGISKPISVFTLARRYGARAR